MRNYMKADLMRLVRRVPQMIVMLLVYAAFAVSVIVAGVFAKAMADPLLADTMFAKALSESFVLESIKTVAPYFTAIVGLLAMLFVFSDDFKAKTAQIAIGVGISRPCIILSKLAEAAILLIGNVIVFTVIGLVINVTQGAVMTGAQVGELVAFLTMNILVSNMAYLALTSILLFTTQSMVISILAFLALSFHAVSGVLGAITYIPALSSIEVSQYTLTHFLGQANEMIGGAFNVKAVLAIIAYMVLGVGIATALYSKKELEF